jgi:hypothetical protein
MKATGGPKCEGAGEEVQACPNPYNVQFSTMTIDWDTMTVTMKPRVPGCADPATEPSPRA